MTGREGLDILCHRSSFFARLSGRLFEAYLSVTDTMNTAEIAAMAESTTKRWSRGYCGRPVQALALACPPSSPVFINKQVDGELSISEIMVKAHRGKVMQKKQADLSLVRMAAKLRLATTPRR